ncbi:MAG: GIY-YIG nuclease family protein [Elusimicrobiota bacterium]
MLRCSGDALYTGIAKDVEARFAIHCSGKGAAYTRSHPPVEVVYRETGMTRSSALVREAAIKSLKKTEKEALASPAHQDRDACARARARRSPGSRRSR